MEGTIDKLFDSFVFVYPYIAIKHKRTTKKKCYSNGTVLFS